jgi:hypothetical protein
MFEEEYIRLVIKPRIDLILEDGVDSIADLVKKFNTAHSCRVSKAKVTEWLKALDYRMTKKIEFNRPIVRTLRVGQPPLEQVPERPVEFRTQHTQQMFNFPAPTGMFANVRMPGFEE